MSVTALRFSILYAEDAGTVLTASRENRLLETVLAYLLRKNDLGTLSLLKNLNTWRITERIQKLFTKGYCSVTC